MENINTDDHYEITERLEDGRFAAKKYEWRTEEFVVESYDCRYVQVGIFNKRRSEYVLDVVFTPNTDCFPEIRSTYKSLRYLARKISVLSKTWEPTGRAIVWNEPFVSYFSEDDSSMQDVSFSIDKLFDIVSKMKNISTEKKLITA